MSAKAELDNDWFYGRCQQRSHYPDSARQTRIRARRTNHSTFLQSLAGSDPANQGG